MDGKLLVVYYSSHAAQDGRSERMISDNTERKFADIDIISKVNGRISHSNLLCPVSKF